MPIAIGQRDEDIEGIPRQRKKIVWFWAFTAEWRHGTSIPVCAIAINGIVVAATGWCAILIVIAGVFTVAA